MQFTSRFSSIFFTVAICLVAYAAGEVQTLQGDSEVMARSPLGPLLGSSMNSNAQPAGKGRLGNSISDIVLGATTGNFPGMAGAITNTVADGKAAKAADQAAANQAQIRARAISPPLNLSMRKVFRSHIVGIPEETIKRSQDFTADDVIEQKRSVTMKDFADRVHVRSFKAMHKDSDAALDKRTLGLKKALLVGKLGLVKGAVVAPLGAAGLASKSGHVVAPC